MTLSIYLYIFCRKYL